MINQPPPQHGELIPAENGQWETGILEARLHSWSASPKKTPLTSYSLHHIMVWTIEFHKIFTSVALQCFFFFLIYCAWGTFGEREREKDGSDVTIVALKLAMSFALLLAKNVHLSIGDEFCAFPCQKICTSVSPLLIGAEFTLSVAKNVALFDTVRILRTVKWRDWQGIEATKQTIEFPAAPFFFLAEKIEKRNQINTKNYWK